VTLPRWAGSALRWYLVSARHPFKNYIVGHYWGAFCRPRMWIDYDNGSLLTVSLGDYLQQRIFFDGYYEQALIGWLSRELTADDVFWDVGANIGAISLVAARRCGHVVAFEPDPRSLPLLREHARASGIDNITIVPAALGATAGAATLHQASASNTGMTSLVTSAANAAGHVSVEVQSADAFFQSHPARTPTVVKIDVEGAEDLVIAGARQLLATAPPRAIVFEARYTDNGRPAPGTAVDVLNASGYRISMLGHSDSKVDDGVANFVARWQGSAA